MLVEVHGRRELPAGRCVVEAFDDEAPSLSLLEEAGIEAALESHTIRLQDNQSIHYRFSASYITGAHSAKVGASVTTGYFHQTNFDVQPVSYRLNQGVPNRITIRALPYEFRTDVDASVGLFAQDSWTLNRLTLGYGLRYDSFVNSYPEHRLEPTVFTPGRNLTIPPSDNLSWHDITPKLGVTYDLFGTGRTALKVSLNKYVEQLAAGATLPSGRNPLNNIISTTTGSWRDADGDYVPDCDLLNPTSNGECGATADPNLGSPRSGATFDPELLTGWGKRGYNWEFSAGVQHEVMPRVSVDVGFFRRWYGNFVVTDNRTLAPGDFDTFSITAPRDPRLPGGGSYTISGLYDLKPARFGLPASNFVTRASNYGAQTETWNGVDVAVNARPRSGLLLQGGLSTGKTTTDNCEVKAKLPELGSVNPYCRVETPFLTQVKGFVASTVPRVGVQVSAAFQNLSGPRILADFTATNALVQPSLGRPLAGGAANVTVGLVEPGTTYGERMNQLDLQFGKLFTFDISTQVTLTGVVTDWVWKNPHCFVLFDVTDEQGNVVNWVAETHPTNFLVRNEVNGVHVPWDAMTLKRGDKVRITLFPSRAGTPRGLLAKVVDANGTVLLDDGETRTRRRQPQTPSQ